MEAVKQDGEALRFTSEVLQRERNIITQAVKQDSHALSHASRELRGGRVYLKQLNKMVMLYLLLLQKFKR